jgi:hypothetical protein
MPDKDCLPLDHRHCGRCTACCTHLPIPAGVVGPGTKPAGVACPHLSGGGCRIYALRPAVCVAFRCAWLADGGWPDAWRPDQSGLFCLRERLGNGLPAAVAYEIQPGALDHQTAAAILAELQRTTAVVVAIDVHERRQRLVGRWRADEAHPVVPAPHFRIGALAHVRVTEGRRLRRQ